MHSFNVIYLTGYSGAGKTTIAKELQRLVQGSVLLDGDIIRSTINADLGFTVDDKIENIRRNNALISMLADQEVPVICAFMASIGEERDKLFRSRDDVLRVQLTTPLETCIRRDPKGHYAKQLKNFAGVTAKYTPLPDPHLEIDTSKLSLRECVDKILGYTEHLRSRKFCSCPSKPPKIAV